MLDDGQRLIKRWNRVGAAKWTQTHSSYGLDRRFYLSRTAGLSPSRHYETKQTNVIILVQRTGNYRPNPRSLPRN